MWQHQIGKLKHRFHIDGKNFVPQVFAGVQAVGVIIKNTRIVHQYIDAAISGQRGVYQILQIRQAGHIHGHGNRLASCCHDGIARGLSSGQIHIRHHHFRALFGKTYGLGLTHA